MHSLCRCPPPPPYASGSSPKSKDLKHQLVRCLFLRTATPRPAVSPYSESCSPHFFLRATSLPHPPHLRICYALPYAAALPTSNGPVYIPLSFMAPPAHIRYRKLMCRRAVRFPRYALEAQSPPQYPEKGSSENHTSPPSSRAPRGFRPECRHIVPSILFPLCSL